MRPAIVAAALLLGACAGGPPPADWQIEAQGALKNFAAAHFAGNSRLATIEFAQARAALARTGDAEQVGRAELYRCATRVAALEFDDCPGFAPLAADAGAAARAYADYLAGRGAGLDAELLPAAQQPVLRGGEAALAGIADPLSRLVGAGVLLRAGRLSPAGIELAVDTATAQGWRRPLLAWLGLQRQRALAAGDTEAAARLGRRIGIAGGAP